MRKARAMPASSCAAPPGGVGRVHVARAHVALLLVALPLVAQLTGCGTPARHAGYYQDDGPPDQVPPGLMSTPDAVPREEPLNPFANQPYRALGRTYTPDTSDRPFRQRGLASWYGRQYHGNRTASGERYDMFAMTAAHPTLPIPSYARVTNLRSGASVVVRINDRGPFLYDRVIDLSYVAALRLGVAGRGTDEVEVQRILPRDIARAHAAEPLAIAAVPPTSPAAAPASLSGAPAGPVLGAAPAAVAVAPVAAVAAPPATRLPPAAPPETAAPGVTPPSTTPPSTVPLSTPTSTPASAASRWGVQVGAFALAAHAEALRDRVALLLDAPDATEVPSMLRSTRVERDGDLFRVLVGPLTDRAAAAQLAQTLARILARATTLYSRP